VLIVDEALSVGDAYFQHKSFNRIREYRKAGTTLLIVSHDKAAIQSICDRAILLSDGRVAMEGQPEEVMDYYNAMLAEREKQCVHRELAPGGKTRTISGSGEAIVADVALLNDQHEKVEVVGVGAPVHLQVKVATQAPIARLIVGYMIKDRLGQVIYGTNTDLKKLPLSNVKPGEEIACSFSFPASLGPGNYSVAVALTSSDTHLEKNFEWRDLALVFNVVNISRERFVGCIWLDPQISIHRTFQNEAVPNN
jgi:lipopolysaccharide transport system ATP-binding protein